MVNKKQKQTYWILALIIGAILIFGSNMGPQETTSIFREEYAGNSYINSDDVPKYLAIGKLVESDSPNQFERETFLEDDQFLSTNVHPFNGFSQKSHHGTFYMCQGRKCSDNTPIPIAKSCDLGDYATIWRMVDYDGDGSYESEGFWFAHAYYKDNTQTYFTDYEISNYPGRIYYSYTCWGFDDPDQQICTPGSRTCQSNIQYKECSADGTEWSTKSCDSGNQCEQYGNNVIDCVDTCVNEWIPYKNNVCAGEAFTQTDVGCGGERQLTGTKTCLGDKICDNGACIEPEDVCADHGDSCGYAETAPECCAGFDCQNFQCVETGECTTGQDKCQEDLFYQCIDSTWKSQGRIDGKCGYDDTAVGEDTTTPEGFECKANGEVWPPWLNCCSGCSGVGGVVCEACTAEDDCEAGKIRCTDGTCMETCTLSGGAATGEEEPTTLEGAGAITSTATEWCLDGVCYPKKDLIKLSELKDTVLADFSYSEFFLSGWREDPANPICAYEIGDVQCKDGGECLQALDSERPSLKDNKLVYDFISPVVTPGGAYTTILSWFGEKITGFSYKESIVNDYGVCVDKERGVFEDLKSWVANLFGLDPGSSTVMLIIIGGGILLVIIVLMLLQPKKRGGQF